MLAMNLCSYVPTNDLEFLIFPPYLPGAGMQAHMVARFMCARDGARAPNMLAKYSVTEWMSSPSWLTSVGPGIVFTRHGSFQDMRALDMRGFCARPPQFCTLGPHGRRRAQLLQVVLRASHTHHGTNSQIQKLNNKKRCPK